MYLITVNLGILRTPQAHSSEIALALAGSSLWLPWQSFLPGRKSIFSGLNLPSEQKHNIYSVEHNFMFKWVFLLYLIFESWGLILNVLFVKAEYKVFYWLTSVKHKNRFFLKNVQAVFFSIQQNCIMVFSMYQTFRRAKKRPSLQDQVTDSHRRRKLFKSFVSHESTPS